MNDTKKCPYCGEEIKATAKKCRFCGEWLEGNTPGHSPQPSSSAPSKMNNATKYVLVGIVAVLAIVIAVVLLGKPSASVSDTAPTETVEADIIPPADHPYTVDEVLENIAEHDANETEEEKENEPWRIHLNKLQGTYLADETDIEMVHTYGMYVISGNTLTQYDWDESSDSWKVVFSSEFQLFDFHDDGYMTGYNLLYTDENGNERRMCSGDLNDDGKMELWYTDSMFWTQQ